MRIRHTEQPPAQHSGESEQDALDLRAELDELLRARQYANQRERRLAEAVRAVPERQRPDAELLRQLAQARTLREGLGTRCLELSEQLTALEDRLRQPPVRNPVPRQPTGARFGGVRGEEEGAHAPSARRAAPPPPATGARFGAPRSRPEEAGEPTPPRTVPAPQPPPAPEEPPEPPRRRSPAELTALAERITALHRQGATQEITSLLGQAAALLLPLDTARLAGLLARGGPPDASVQLARGAAAGTPTQAASTLAELRSAGLAQEATELFHALWAYPADALPALLVALERAGQHADSATLLWEWGSAPTAELAALAAGLERAGRSEDARTLLRQAAGRPAAELTDLAGTLPEPLSGVLLRDLAALRPPTELVRLATALAPHRRLYDGLLAALLEDEGRHRSTLASLRGAGLPTAPAGPPRSRWGRR
ncbi:hypothetical protein ACIF6L_06400 [Kitasatospora sp. NPDC086009]|uniref:hypothetical protein n=1 Tax=unclassified Kitasatospora TaxID=2633591 RepID=UPI0037C7E6A3